MSYELVAEIEAVVQNDYETDNDPPAYPLLL